MPHTKMKIPLLILTSTLTIASSITAHAAECIAFSDANFGLRGSVWTLNKNQRIVVEPRLAYIGSVMVERDEQCRFTVKDQYTRDNLYSTLNDNTHLNADYTLRQANLIFLCDCGQTQAADTRPRYRPRRSSTGSSRQGEPSAPGNPSNPGRRGG